MIFAHEYGTHISPLDGYLYLIAAFLILVVVLGIGILIGYFLMRSADKYHPVRPSARRATALWPTGRRVHCSVARTSR